QKVGIELDVEAALCLIRLRVQIGKRCRISLQSPESRSPKWRKRFGGHDPGRDHRRQALAEEWAEHALPTLDIARRPIVEEAKPEHMIGRVFDRDRFSQ